MSNSTRQGGYDERLVVPLEASRRGAHRARSNPLVAALPLLAVVVVVAAVIGVAYALFLKPGGDTRASDPLASVSSPGPTGAAPSQSASQPAASQSPSTAASSASASPAAPVNKSSAVTVYNGTLNNGTTVNGLAKSTENVLSAAGFTKTDVNSNPWRSTPISETTVFYAKPEQQATAQAVVKALGAGKAVAGKTPGGGIVVVAYSDLKR
jgi:hypothetical protein